MGKGAPLRWIENKLLSRYLRGRGVEIGALWRMFPLRSGATVWYVDRVHPEALQKEYPEVHQQLVPPDIVADAAQMPFRDGSLDFLIASHVLEHMPFPLTTLRHWYRTLAPGGVLLLKIPDKRYTFDTRRQRTTLQHLIDEDQGHSAFDKRTHFEDWVEHVVGRERGTEEFAREIARMMEIDYSIHYHAWTDEDVREFIDYSRESMNLKWRPVLFFKAHFYRKESIVLLRRD